MDDLKRGDLLEITRETVNYFMNRLGWDYFFQQQHIGESVYFGGRDRLFEGSVTLLFQDGRGAWLAPECPMTIITKMREAYLVTQQEKDNA